MMNNNKVITIIIDYKNEQFCELIDFFLKVTHIDNPNHEYVTVDEVLLIESLLHPQHCPFPYSMIIYKFIDYLYQGFGITSIISVRILNGEILYIQGICQ